ncbi:hypothetical protein ROZALSC1DRAFT_27891 [Rozella allomycis CSF55]|uniref:Uncharacterized protein n=1 Tax=Rozella allomycis (strain CSF55) TaxID=988480 RepID=A0A075AY76_ROZAC|nr:hypothetical protein O9G_000671 [Rozella allomycis CSF55]RKP20638.1 hypothetical protein ROZALSC1DRAFT_27891 [Rozella allomycis CSF55]|eukprot:EPZ35275.1 hypothetical protein O9G_000671 [Rozella allomycis CSF55]
MIGGFDASLTRDFWSSLDERFKINTKSLYQKVLLPFELAVNSHIELSTIYEKLKHLFSPEDETENKQILDADKTLVITLETFGGVDIKRLSQFRIPCYPYSKQDFGKLDPNKILMALQSKEKIQVKFALTRLVVVSSDENILFPGHLFPCLMTWLVYYLREFSETDPTNSGFNLTKRYSIELDEIELFSLNHLPGRNFITLISIILRNFSFQEDLQSTFMHHFSFLLDFTRNNTCQYYNRLSIDDLTAILEISYSGLAHCKSRLELPIKNKHYIHSCCLEILAKVFYKHDIQMFLINTYKEIQTIKKLLYDVIDCVFHIMHSIFNHEIILKQTGAPSIENFEKTFLELCIIVINHFSFALEEVHTTQVKSTLSYLFIISTRCYPQYSRQQGAMTSTTVPPIYVIYHRLIVFIDKLSRKRTGFNWKVFINQMYRAKLTKLLSTIPAWDATSYSVITELIE